MARWTLLLPLALLACNEGAGKIEVSDDTGVEADTDTDTDADSDSDSDADADSDTDTDTDTDTDVDYGDAQVSGVSSRLHGDIETLIYVSWEQLADAQVWVEYSFDEDEWHSSPPFQATAGPQEQLLLGVPYATDVTYRVVNDFGEGPTTSSDYSATTGDLPDDMPVPELLQYDESQADPDSRFLYTSINEQTGGWNGGDDFWQVILDRKGRVVWAMEPNNHWTIFVRISYDGDDLMWDDATEWVFSASEDGQVHRMKIDGTIVESYETPGLHHAWTELADGTIAWGSADWTDETLETLAPDGTRRTVWRCSDFEEQAVGYSYYCQSNTLYWHEETDTFLYSFYTSNTVVHIDHATGESVHWWGELSDWDFDPASSHFTWQHGVNFLENGNLLLSTQLTDANANYDRSTATLAAREFSIDDEGDALHEVWSFGEDEGIEGWTAGEAHRLGNGNTLHNYGSGARMREVTDAGEIVWEVKWPDGDNEGRGRLQGRSIFVDDLYRFAP